jgi:hypothetical protein
VRSTTCVVSLSLQAFHPPEFMENHIEEELKIQMWPTTYNKLEFVQIIEAAPTT